VLDVRCFGRIEITIDGVNHMPRLNLRRALFFCYLARHAEAQPREKIAHLLWPNADTELARVNLRSFVKRLRQDGFAPYLNVARGDITLKADGCTHVDLAELYGLIASPQTADMQTLMQAAACYRGPLFHHEDLGEFPELSLWVDAQQRELEMRMVQVYQRLIPHLLTQAQADQAIVLAEALIDLVPYDDASQLLYLQALAATWRVADALVHLNLYRRTMTEEAMEIELVAEFATLEARLRAPDAAVQLFLPDAPSVGQSAGVQTTDSVRSHPNTVIIGRAAEAARLTALLDQGARLISVTGLGGIGKTAFVRSLQTALRTRFAGRLHLVDLRGETRAGEDAATTLLQAVARALAMMPRRDVPLEDQVQAALATAPVCLILDNFETLHGAALYVARLVDQTPTLTVIATSRQALYTKDEALVELGGLGIAAQAGFAGSEGPGTASADDDWSEGATLFLQRAAQHVVGFDRTLADHRAEVEALCAQLGGHPLAIELAAAQLDFYGLEELLASTRTEVDVLATGQGDLPGDHGNLALLLEPMWAPLSSQARTVLARLSVFAGAFHRTAMMTVAPASIEVYRELRRASLLQTMDEPAWFSLHPLVKQAAAGQLATDAAAHTDAHTRHARHYLEFLDLGDEPLIWRKIREPAVWSRLQRTAVDLHLAWGWAVQTADWTRLAQAITGFAHLHILNVQYQRGYALLDELMQALPPAAQWNSSQTQLAERAALFISYLGVYGGALAAAGPWNERALTWLDAIVTLVSCRQMDEAEMLLTAMAPATDQPPQELTGAFRATRSLLQCTLLADRGELDAAIAAMQPTIRLYTRYHSGQASLAYGFLALCLVRRGDMDEAVATARQGLEYIHALRGRYLMGYAQQRLAEVLLVAENFAPVAHRDEVLSLLEQSLAAGLEYEDVQLIFSALYALGHARRADIPPALFERMIKIGACSSALYYEMHPIGRERLAAEGITLTDEEAEELCATDLEQTKALATEIRARLS
jgi:DNA-binding SARP family transcriptional activator/predicted ATPase/tetratricopeptide (TPR) repeat protein